MFLSENLGDYNRKKDNSDGNLFLKIGGIYIY